MGKIITLQKDVRESEFRGLEKMVLEGKKTSKVVKATQNDPCIGIPVILVIIITCNRPQRCLYSISETFNCAAGDPISNFVDSELPKTPPHFVLNTNTAVQGCFPNSGPRHLEMWDWCDTAKTKENEHLPLSPVLSDTDTSSSTGPAREI